MADRYNGFLGFGVHTNTRIFNSFLILHLQNLQPTVPNKIITQRAMQHCWVLLTILQYDLRSCDVITQQVINIFAIMQISCSISILLIAPTLYMYCINHMHTYMVFEVKSINHESTCFKKSWVSNQAIHVKFTTVVIYYRTRCCEKSKLNTSQY